MYAGNWMKGDRAMQETLREYLNELTWHRQVHRKRLSALLVLALFVVSGVVWQLRLTGITFTDGVYCGYEEHTHDENCFGEPKLICAENTEPHVHTEANGCYEMQSVLSCQHSEHTHAGTCWQTVFVCGEDHEHTESCAVSTLVCEIEEHIHNEECHIAEQILICNTEEGSAHTHAESCYEPVQICQIEEHAHDLNCYSDLSAVESESDWLASVPGGYTGYWGEDLLSVAKSQLGYTESIENFISDEAENRHGYTRYGHWYGEDWKYADWNVLFVSFCLNYAGIPESAVPYAATYSQWAGQLSAKGCSLRGSSYIPEPGDIAVLVDIGTNAAKLAVVDHMEGEILTVIQGDANGCVQRIRYDLNVTNFLGILSLADVGAPVRPVSETECAEDIQDTAAPAEETVTTTEGMAPAALTEEEKTQVDDLIFIIDTLPAAEEVQTEQDRLSAQENSEALEAYQQKILALITSAWEEYDSMTEAQKASVTNVNKLIALKEVRIGENGPTILDWGNAEAIEDEIADLPTVEEARSCLESLTGDARTEYQENLICSVSGLMAAYTSLPEEAKPYTENIDALQDLMAWLEEVGLIQPAPDYTASGDGVTASVRVEGTILPEGAQFVLSTALAYREEEINGILGRIEGYLDQYEQNVLQYVLLDMYFADALGEEIPFAGSAEITLNFDEPILPGANQIQVFHIGSDTVENVCQDVVRTEAGITSLTITADSFSPYVVASTGKIGEKLNGDFAYIYDAMMKPDENTTSGQAISTGTASWDKDDSAGNDSSAANSILRTFDVATYTLTYKTGLRKEATDQGINGYRTGTVYFEFILPLSAEKGQFEPGSMGWLATYSEMRYEIVKEEDRQILRGSFLAAPSANNPATIGNSISEMNVAIRVLRMKQGDTVQPTFTLWLEGNDVDAGVVNGIPTKVVTGTNGTCGTHNEQEHKTIVPERIVISAAPRFNVALKKGDTGSTSYVETFDFNTGNDQALDKINESMNGRLVGYGLTLQLVGKDKTSGLKGAEIPDEGSEISFDITLSSTYTIEGGVVDLSNTEFRPRVWSAAPNMRDVTQQDGRANTGSVIDFMRMGAPYNEKPAVENPSVNQKFLDYCYDGGDWSFTQEASNPNVIHVTVRNFRIDLSSLQNFPAATAAHNGEPNSCPYYNPADASLQNAWDIQFACFSAAEFWTFQPLQAKVDGTSKKIQDTYGNGSIEFKIQDSNLKVNKTGTTQAVTTDDQLADGIGLTQTGSRQVQIHYVKPGRGWGSPLTDDCFENGYDWATPGQNVAIYQLMVNDNAMGDARGAAFEMLIKWDDVFFEPTGDYWTDCNTPLTGGTWWSGDEPVVEVLWATIDDGLGWKHNGLNPDQSEGNTDGSNYDWDMIQATPDMLTYYSTLAEVKAAGKVPVGLLVQYRGICGPGQNHIEIRVEGKVKEDCPTGYVYMTTQFATMWTVDNLAVPARDHYYKTHNDTTAEEKAYWEAHREEIIDNYARTVMPLRSQEPELLDYMANRVDGHAARTKADWIRGYSGTASAYARYSVSLGNDFLSMRKIWYKDGQTGGTSNDYLLDSCLVPEHVTSIKKNTAQTSTQNGITENKQTYSLDLNQRVVDYALTPSITRTLGDGAAAADSKTTITIVDTLPPELQYIPDSAYWGGTYTQDPGCMTQGSVTGGTKIDPVIGHFTKAITLEDGKTKDVTYTTLTWTLPDVSLATHGTVELAPIYFSARLTGDFVDQQGVDNTVTIQSTGDNKRPLTQANNNQATYGITIQMSKTVSIVKLADQDKVEIDAPHGFTMYVGNNSSNDTKHQIIVDDLPYNGDQSGTSVHGPINVTEFSANDIGLDNVKWFYTTDTQFRGKTSTYYMGDSVAGKGAGQIGYFIPENGWYPLEFENGTATNLPQTTVQVVGVGTVPAGQTIQMHTTVELPGSQGGDVVYNNLMMDSLNSRASSRVVSRSLSGLTWLDTNCDGIQNAEEMPAQSGVKVTLMKLDENGVYQDVVSIQTGQKCDVIRGKTVADHEEGKYLFYNLLPGTYAVRFEKGDFDITYYHPSPVDTGMNLDQYDQIDSDGVPTLREDHTLLQTEIIGIVMPTIEEMGETHIYDSPYHDSGFYAWSVELPSTGGGGTYVYTIGGWLLTGGGGLLMYRKKRKN